MSEPSKSKQSETASLLKTTNAERREPGHRPAPILLHGEPTRRGLIHLPGNWSNGNRFRNANRRVGDYNGGMGDYNGGMGDYNQGNGFAGPVGDYNGPMGTSILVGMGYHSDLADCHDQDWHDLDAFIRADKKPTSPVNKMAARAAEQPPPHHNLGNNPLHPLPPVENQGRTNSCTAQAAAGMLEYLYRWATGEYNDFSRIFIYFNSRKLLGWPNDTGSYIRTTFKAMRLFGAPPEPEWPFDTSLLNVEPLPYHYAYASNFKTLKYARLDGYNEKSSRESGDAPTEDLYDRVKRIIYSGFPVEFGFPVYSCIQNLQDYIIPIPGKKDTLLGGHAVLAVGYDDAIIWPPRSETHPEAVPGRAGSQGGAEPTNQTGTLSPKPGALIIRNSWGPDWGDHGYAFLPRWYLDQGYASDFWTAYDNNWLNLDQFGN